MTQQKMKDILSLVDGNQNDFMVMLVFLTSCYGNKFEESMLEDFGFNDVTLARRLYQYKLYKRFEREWNVWKENLKQAKK